MYQLISKALSISESLEKGSENSTGAVISTFSPEVNVKPSRTVLNVTSLVVATLVGHAGDRKDYYKKEREVFLYIHVALSNQSGIVS